MIDPNTPSPASLPIKRINSDKTRQRSEKIDMQPQALQSVEKAKNEKIPVPKTAIRRPPDYHSNQRYLDKMVKQMTGTPDYSVTEAKVCIPPDLVARSSELEKACLQDFKQAQSALEGSIAEVALAHPDAKSIIQKLDQRIYLLMRAYAEVLLEDEGKFPLSPAAGPRVKEDCIELKVNEIMVNMFSQTKSTGVQEGITTEAGNVGMNPLAIRKALKKGNMREKMYIPYKTLAGFADVLFKNPETVDRVNAKLNSSKTGWMIDTQQVEAILKVKPGPYDYGLYASKTKADKLRTGRPIKEREEVAEQQNVSVSDKERPIPLSYREKMMITGELSPDKTRLSSDLKKAYTDRAQEKPKWQSGKAWYTVSASQHNAYRLNEEKLELAGIAGISGTVDQFMTTALFVGLNSRRDLEQLRLALLGWLIEAQDHSYHEIMMSSKTFGLDYHPSAESYKDIYPGDVDFAKKVEESQRSKGFPMPADCLQEEYVRAKT